MLTNMQKALALFLLSLACSVVHAQTGWSYHAGQISPMTDTRIDRFTVRSTEPFHDPTGALIFAVLTVECSPGGPHPVWFTSTAHLDADISGNTSVNMRFGLDAPTGPFNVPLYRDGISLLLPSANDATALKMAGYDRLRMQLQVHGQVDQFVEFSIGGLRTVAESHNCPLSQ